MSQQKFADVMDRIAGDIANLPLNDDLRDHLNARFGPDSEEFNLLGELCAQGEAEGWLMSREAGGVKFGRALKPDEMPGHFSVDVVRMQNVRGPHHIHTTGEIGAILPLSGAPLFDGLAEGWYVYPPGSDHHPTVTGGDAYVLYLLPDGAIEFTGK